MGAVAFVMADFLQLPYKEVAIRAILPRPLLRGALHPGRPRGGALRLRQGRSGTRSPRAWTVLKRGWLFLAPFVALVYTMFWLNLEPEYCAMAASAVIIALGFAFGYDSQRDEAARPVGLGGEYRERPVARSSSSRRRRASSWVSSR